MLKIFTDNRFKKNIGKFKSGYTLLSLRARVMLADKILYILIISLLGIFRPDAFMLVVYFLIYLYLYLTFREDGFYHLYLSTFIAVIWVILANDYYGYNTKMFTIFGLNSFPLFAWSAGLFGAYFLFSNFERYIKGNFLKKLALFSIFYWIALITVETIGYHYFNIQNITTAVYQGLPFCNCIHAPSWMQLSYFLMGPLYFTLCKTLKLTNPHENLHLPKESCKDKNQKINLEK